MTNVLVVDDNAADVNLLRLICEGANEPFAILGAANLDEAFAILSTQGADLILLDVNMPGAPWPDSLRSLTTTGVPIIVLSGAVDAQTARLAKAYGAAEYLVKGDVQFMDLLRIMRGILTG